MNSINNNNLPDNNSTNLFLPIALPIQKPDGVTFNIKSHPRQAPSLNKQTTNDFLNKIFKKFKELGI
jgi:hypothetical protein